MCSYLRTSSKDSRSSHSCISFLRHETMTFKQFSLSHRQAVRCLLIKRWENRPSFKYLFIWVCGPCVLHYVQIVLWWMEMKPKQWRNSQLVSSPSSLHKPTNSYKCELWLLLFVTEDKTSEISEFRLLKKQILTCLTTACILRARGHVARFGNITDK